MPDDVQPVQSMADGDRANRVVVAASGSRVTSDVGNRSASSVSSSASATDMSARGLTASGLTAGDDMTAGEIAASGNEVTVLRTTTALEAEEFPQGLSPRELALALKGQLLGHFHLQEFIGGGGMGAVFKALDTTLDRIVAVKVVASQSVSSEELQRRFLIEAQSTARLDHPNIARIHYVGRDRGLPFIVFEYIDGVNLRDLVLNHGPIPLGDALSFTAQIAHALAHAWQKEVVHRDIKPSNILITREGQAKLVDMGLARLHQVDAVENDLTSTGVTLGTFDYISPEQARDPREADTRSDIYSLGCTLFYMLTGRAPFADGTAVQKLLQHQDQSPPNLSDMRPDVPESLAHLVRHMLAKSPEDRPQTPGELVAVCHEILLELGLQPPQSLTPLPVIAHEVNAATWRIHLPWAIPLAALLAVGGGWMATPHDRTESVKFPPLRVSTIAELEASPLQEEAPVEPVRTSERLFEVTEQGSSAPRAEESSSINIGKIFDFATPSTWSAGEPSLLEFPVDEPVLSEGTSGQPDESIDIGSILLAE